MFRGLICLISFMVLTHAGLQAQVKIGDGTVPRDSAVPNDNAVLDLSSGRRGVLFPQLALSSTKIAAPLSGHVAGMMVYNTSRTADVVPAIYYNDGSQWIYVGARGSDITYNQQNYTIGYTDDAGVPQVIDLVQAVRANQTITQLQRNPDGTFTYYKEDDYTDEGVLKPEAEGTTIDPAQVNVLKEGDSYVFIDSQGNGIGEISFTAEDIRYTDVTNQLDALNVQMAIDQLLARIQSIQNTSGDVTAGSEKVLLGGMPQGAALQSFSIDVDETKLDMNSVKVIQRSYVATLKDGVLLGDAAGGDITVTLPEARDSKGMRLVIKKEDGNEDHYVTVIGRINGTREDELYTAVPYTGWELVSDGASWRIINKF